MTLNQYKENIIKYVKDYENEFLGEVVNCYLMDYEDYLKNDYDLNNLMSETLDSKLHKDSDYISLIEYFSIYKIEDEMLQIEYITLSNTIKQLVEKFIKFDDDINAYIIELEKEYNV